VLKRIFGKHEQHPLHLLRVSSVHFDDTLPYKNPLELSLIATETQEGSIGNRSYRWDIGIDLYKNNLEGIDDAVYSEVMESHRPTLMQKYRDAEEALKRQPEVRYREGHHHHRDTIMNHPIIRELVNYQEQVFNEMRTRQIGKVNAAK